MISTLTLVNWLAFVEAHPHDFTIQYPARREYFIQNFRCEPAPRTSEWLSDLDQLLLYLHIPFCEAKCYYCNFAVDVNRSEDFHRKYVDALLRELDFHADWLPNCEIAGVDIGGGTPTMLATSELRRIARAVKPLLKKVPARSRSASRQPRESLRKNKRNFKSYMMKAWTGSALGYKALMPLLLHPLTVCDKSHRPT